MQKIILSGCNGKMGQFITKLVKDREDMEIVAGIDVYTAQLADYPVYAKLDDFTGEADIVIDYTVAANTEALLAYCTAHSLPVIIATTGQSAEQLATIKAASEKIAIFKSANMSLGINLMADLIKRAAAILGDAYDVEIIEKHHNQKLDAPSGTALMLADAVSEALPYEPEYCYERESRRAKRPQNEIGIHSIRGGTIVGEHEVMFAGNNEVISVKHIAESRESFAVGTISAAKFMFGKKSGIYDMNDLISAN